MQIVESAFDQDLSNSKKVLDKRECMRQALAQTGKSYGAQVREIYKLSRGDGRLAAQDYYTYRLYDDQLYSFDDKKRFLSESIHYKIIQNCCNIRWWATADDKFVAYTLLEGCGMPVPETQAIYSRGARGFGKTAVLRAEADVVAYLTGDAAYPVFAKSLEGVGSFGAYLIEGKSGDALSLAGGETISVQDFVARLDAEQGYLFQSRLAPHRDLEPFGDMVSTVRVIVVVEEDGPQILHTVWKIPANGNYADNFWRDGNLLGAVDSETGTVDRVVRGVGPWQEELTHHPDTDAEITGIRLPDWQELAALCLDGARLFSPIRYQSWDVALCPEGPVIVEVNTGSAFNLSQLATGKGFLTDRFANFLTGCGYKLKSRR